MQILFGDNTILNKLIEISCNISAASCDSGIICLRNDVNIIKKLCENQQVEHFAENISSEFVDEVRDLIESEKMIGYKIIYLPKKLEYKSTPHAQVFDLGFKLLYPDDYKSVYGVSADDVRAINKALIYKKLSLLDFIQQMLNENKFGGIEKFIFRYIVIGEELC